MNLRHAIVGLLLALPVVLGACDKESPNEQPKAEVTQATVAPTGGLPVGDQAIQDLKDQVNLNDPVQRDAVSAGYRLAAMDVPYVPVGTESELLGATLWLPTDMTSPEMIIKDGKVVQMRAQRESFGCNVPATNTWGAAALRLAFADLIGQTRRERAEDPFLKLPASLSATQHGATQQFMCG